MSISIIIPTLNEEDNIEPLINRLRNCSTPAVKEIIVVDGGSEDKTVPKARKAGAKVIHSDPGRAVQMNKGAEEATASIYYFLHADTMPPKGFDKTIEKSVQEGAGAGCFRLQFDNNHVMLRFYAWCTRFSFDAFRFGDQSLYISKELFVELDGFDESLTIMEDFEIIKRIKQKSTFKLETSSVVTSARRYEKHGVILLQLTFVLIFTLYRLGVSQKTLLKIYESLNGKK